MSETDEQPHAKIIIQNAVWSRLRGLTDKAMSVVKDKMSVTDQKRYQASKHTGFRAPLYCHFIDDEGWFLTGLVPNVEVMMEEMGIPFKVYKTASTPQAIQIDESLIHDRIVMPRGQPLRKDQVDFLRAIATWLRGGVEAATGYGKTAVLAAALKILPPKTLTLVIINSVDLISQTYDTLTNEFGISEDILGIYNGEVKRCNWITLTTVDSLPALKELLPDVQVIFADEVHYKVTSPSSVRWLKLMEKAMIRIWFSATPNKRKDKVHNWKLLGHFGPSLGVAKAKDLQEKGILSQCKVIFHLVNIPEGGSGDEDDTIWSLKYKDAYDQLVVQNKGWHDRVAALIRSLEGRSIVFVERIDHGNELVERVNNLIWVSGKDSKKFRKEVREKLQVSPDNTPVVSTRIFKTGVDTFVHNVVNCSAMSSEIGTVQGFGRGLRLATDKDGAVYHDFIFMNNDILNRHSKDRVRDLKREGHIIEIVDDLEEIYEKHDNR